MRRVLICCVLLVMSATSILAEDFSWSSNKTDIILQQGTPPTYEESNAIVYSTNKTPNEMLKYLSIDYILVDTRYNFEDNQLVSVEQAFTPDDSSKGEPELFEELSKYLTSKYGEPIAGTEVWINSKKEGNHFLLVLAGELKLLRVWRTEKTTVFLSQKRMENQNGPYVHTVISYFPNASHYPNIP